MAAKSPFDRQKRGTPETGIQLFIVMICAMMGMFMQALDGTIANVALPYMQGSLQASRDQVTWVLTSYIIAAAIMTAPVGWLSARIGRKNLFVISMTGFTVTSMLCGAAMTLDQIIIFRLLQGVFGASLSPLSQSVVLDRYPAEKRGKIMSIWGMVVMIGPILGPTLGGYLTDNYSWRWVFYVNLPFGILATTGLVLFLSPDDKNLDKPFDMTGFGFFAVMIAAFQLMLDRGTTKDWFSSPEIVAETVIAGLAAYLFIVHFFTSKRTFIPHGLFNDRNYMSAVALTFFIGMLMLATSALLPPFLQNLGGYTVLDTGLMVAPRGLGTIVTMTVMGYIVMRIDVRIPMFIGCALLSWAMWEMSQWTPNVTPMMLGVTTFIQGLGMGMVFIPANVMAFATLPATLRTDAAAMINLVRNIGAGVGISITSTVLAMNAQVVHASLAAHVTPFNRALGVNAPSLMWSPRLPFGLKAINGIIQRNAMAISYSDVFHMMLFLSLPTFIVLLLIPKPAETLPDVEPEMTFLE